MSAPFATPIGAVAPRGNSNECYLFDFDGEHIGMVELHHYAEFIVTAVNAHDALLAERDALKATNAALVEALAAVLDAIDASEGGDELERVNGAVQRAAFEVLAKARGGK